MSIKLISVLVAVLAMGVTLAGLAGGPSRASSPWQKYDPPLRGLSPFFAPS